MTAFIDAHRSIFGVEPICRVLPIAPSTYHAHTSIARKPALASKRGQRGVRKVWHGLRRKGRSVVRCMVERLMKALV